MFSLFVNSIWQVLVVGLVVGAGVPALFAVGMRELAYGHGEGPDGGRHPMGNVLAYVCFALVLLVVALGITIIVSSGFGYKVSFEHVFPMLVKK